MQMVMENFRRKSIINSRRSINGNDCWQCYSFFSFMFAFKCSISRACLGFIWRSGIYVVFILWTQLSCKLNVVAICSTNSPYRKRGHAIWAFCGLKTRALKKRWKFFIEATRNYICRLMKLYLCFIGHFCICILQV